MRPFPYIYLPICQTLGRDLDCHASMTKDGKDKRIKVRKYTGCIVKNRLKTEQVSRERRVFNLAYCLTELGCIQVNKVGR